jgi:hypothetical protein
MVQLQSSKLIEATHQPSIHLDLIASCHIGHHGVSGLELHSKFDKLENPNHTNQTKTKRKTIIFFIRKF